MEAVKDTLWKWAIQLSALAGLGYSTLSLISHLLSHRGTSADVLRFTLAMGFVMGPLLGMVWLQLVYRKKWAGWLVWSLSAVAATFSLLATSMFGRDPIGLLYLGLNVGYAALLFCGLVFKPQLWREGA